MKRFPEGREPRALKWRGWTVTGQSLGVVEAVNQDEAIKKFRKRFGGKLDLVTTAYRGAETTVAA